MVTWMEKDAGMDAAYVPCNFHMHDRYVSLIIKDKHSELLVHD